jgi:hypothetical protein
MASQFELQGLVTGKEESRRILIIITAIAAGLKVDKKTYFTQRESLNYLFILRPAFTAFHFKRLKPILK